MAITRPGQVAALATAAVLLASAARGQSFSYPDFTSPSLLALAGDASIAGTALRLTANASNQAGWCFRQSQVSLAYGFTTSFTFRMLPSPFGTKGQGLAFILHGQPVAAAVGGTAWGLGYGSGANAAPGISRSLVLEIDTFRDLFLGDTSDNEVSLHTRGQLGNREEEAHALARQTPVTNLADGLPHTLTLRYQPGQLQLFLDGAATPLLSRPWSHSAGGTLLNGQAVTGLGLTNDQAFVGFSATTGAGTLAQLTEVLAWDFAATPAPNACYQGTFPGNLLTVQGQAGGPLRTVQLGIGQAFGIQVGVPPGSGPASPYALFVSLLPQPGAPGTLLPFGSTCFPVLPLGALELVLADTLGIGGGLVSALPAPFTVPLPAGAVTTALDVTVQAVVLANTSPPTLGISNAIDIEFRPSPPPTVATVAPGSAVVGGTITVTGSGFLPGALVHVGSTQVTPSTLSANQLTFPYPGGVACGGTLRVRNPDGLSASGPLNPVPQITNTLPASGPAAGGQSVVLVGSGFAPGSTVTIGGIPAMVNLSATAVITLTSPPGSAGPQQVVVTTPGGCSATTTYTYL